MNIRAGNRASRLAIQTGLSSDKPQAKALRDQFDGVGPCPHCGRPQNTLLSIAAWWTNTVVFAAIGAGLATIFRDTVPAMTIGASLGALVGITTAREF